MLRNYRQKLAKYNQLLPLADYLMPLVGDKKEIKIADVGSGPYSITGQLVPGVEVAVFMMDQQDFKPFWEKYETVPLFLVEYQDMEKLTYEDGYFDITHCVNALDHTKDALAALKEMIRVTKPGGYIYIDCALIQHTNRGHRHFWDMLEDGTMTDGKTSFNLKDFGFTLEFIDNGGERQFNHVIGIKKCFQS